MFAPVERNKTLFQCFGTIKGTTLPVMLAVVKYGEFDLWMIRPYRPAVSAFKRKYGNAT
jgi:hypothetical protein